jgi:acyl-CoA dehydrogenase
MDFAFSPRVEELRKRLSAFLDERIYPSERHYDEQRHGAGDPRAQPDIMEELKVEARKRGLWNLFLRDPRWGAGLSTLEYAPLAELLGRSQIAPEATNCSAPDTGNIELLAEVGTAAQQERWLRPLLDGEIRSCFAMTEPDVAGSDPTNIRSRIDRDGDHYVINGRKWWTTGAANPRTKLCVFMGVTDSVGEPYRRHSLVLIPMDAPGVKVVRGLTTFGYRMGAGEAEVAFEDVRVPMANRLGEEGNGFAIAQARLGTGRIHHCMRAVGAAERAFELMCRRAHQRVAFGKPLAEQGVVQRWIAESRMEIEQARLLVLKAAWMMDSVGREAARIEVSAIKVIAPRVALRVIDRAIQVHGAAGVSSDTPLAAMYAAGRTLRIADGPDEVHQMVIARAELSRLAT